MAAARMPDRCVIAGGGRWARVVLRELLGVLPPSTPITVVSPSAADVMKELLTKDAVLYANAARIEVRRELPAGRAGDMGIAVVVNKPAQHHPTAMALLARGYHVLVEKPFTAELDHARDLLAAAEIGGRVVAAGLVFLAAEYVHEFRRRLPFVPAEASAVEIDWEDPPVEMRYGEAKRISSDVSLGLEVLPHAWSALKAIFGAGAPIEFALAAATGKSRMTVAGNVGGMNVRIRIDAAATARRRLIALRNAAGDAVLDFTGDPAVAMFAGAAPVHLPIAGREGRPMARMLRGFIDYVRRRDGDAAWQRGIVTGPAILEQMEAICGVEHAYRALKA